MTRRTSPRYPELDVASLLRHTSSVAALAELSGVGCRRLHRHSHTGLTLELADTLATALNLHPVDVWPGWFDVERRAKVAERKRAQRRRASEAQRQREREYARRYRQEAKAAVSLKQRLYKQAHADELREYDRRYREANRERIAARQRAYNRENRELIAAKQRERDRKRRAA